MHPELVALSQSEIQSKLHALPGWSVQDGALSWVHKFSTYKDALDFVYKVGMEAEKNDHHPDMRLDFKTVTVRYSTHSANGITELDVKMAGVVDKLAKK